MFSDLLDVFANSSQTLTHPMTQWLFSACCSARLLPMLAKRSNGWWWYGGKIFLHTTTSRGGTIMRTAQALHRVNNSKQLLTTKLKKVANISACFSWKTWSLFLHATLQSCNPNKFLEVKRSQNTNSLKWHMNAEHIYFDAILKTVGFEFSIEKQWLKNFLLPHRQVNHFPPNYVPLYSLLFIQEIYYVGVSNCQAQVPLSSIAVKSSLFFMPG